jgi:heme exporter protein D
MEAVRTYFAMGGYAVYVWPSYALFAVVIVGLVVLSLRGMRRREAELDRLRSGRRERNGRGDSPAGEEDE